jgi:hypothetical protein
MSCIAHQHGRPTQEGGLVAVVGKSGVCSVVASVSGASPQGRPTYSPRGATNCKPWEKRSPERARERANSRARREYARLLRGIEHPCWTLVLTRDRCIDLNLRRHAWHVLLTRMRERWPDVQAWTMYEWGQKRRGLHLHIVIKGAPAITREWVIHVVSLLGDGTEVHMQEMRGDIPLLGGDAAVSMRKDRGTAAYVARYLTKQVANPSYFRQWPPRFRPISVTRGWCQDWKPARASRLSSAGS